MNICLPGLVEVIGGKKQFCFSNALYNTGSGGALRWGVLGFDEQRGETHAGGQLFASNMIAGQLPECLLGSAVFSKPQLQHSHVVERHETQLLLLEDTDVFRSEHVF